MWLFNIYHIVTLFRGEKTDEQNKNFPHKNVENNVINPEQILVQVKVPWKIKHRLSSCIFPFPLPQLLPPINSMTEMFLCFQDFWTLTRPKLSQGQRRVGVWVIMCKQRGFIAFTSMSLSPWLWSPSANSGRAWLKKGALQFLKWGLKGNLETH